MDSLRIHCPDCATEYVFAPENRGVSVQCPVCQGVFQVPREGDLAVVVTHGRRPQPAAAVAAPAAPAMFQLTCPKCGTAYSIPEAYRGNQGECGICNTTFLIPATGTVGQWVSGGPAAPAAVPASAPTAGQPALPKRPYSGTSTMALSRASIIHNTMTPKEKDAKGTAAPPSGPLAAPRSGTATGSLPRGGTATGGLPRASAPRPGVPPAASPAVAAVPAPPPASAVPHKPVAPPPAPAAGHRVVLPAWLARVPLNPGELVRDWKPAPQEGAAVPLVATLLPVVCTVLGAGLAGSLVAVLSAVLFTLLGGAAWGFFAFVCLPALRRPRAVIVTDQRVILVAGETVAAVAQHQPPET